MIVPHTHDCQICQASYRVSGKGAGWLSLRTEEGYLYSACSSFCWSELKSRHRGLRETVVKRPDRGFW